MSKSDKGTSSEAERRKARLAEQLRVNLQKRKAQTRARRAGEEDSRRDGLGSQKAEEKPQ